METRANYALIGVFTLAVVLAAFGFVYWFAGPIPSGRQEVYEIVFSGSVSGLTRGSSVLFNCVKVGEVTDLAAANGAVRPHFRRRCSKNLISGENMRI